MEQNILLGSQNLLFDVYSALKGFDYVIIGGWCPYFACMKSGRMHPGTKDVDVLFNDSKMKDCDWDKVVNALVGNGFKQSAKHPFQLWKEYNVINYKFMYNVDLMHPSGNAIEKKEASLKPRYDYHVPENIFGQRTYHMETINLLNSEHFFDEILSSMQKVNVQLLNGLSKEIEIRLLNEAGVIVSKADSYSGAKRFRDAFDICVSILNADEELLKTNLSDYKDIIKKITYEKLNDRIHSYFDKMEDVFHFSKDDYEKIKSFCDDVARW